MGYIVLTGDLRSSRQMEDRHDCQLKLKNALNFINKAFNEFILSEFRIIGGDGFQGMISEPGIILDVYYALFEMIDHPFYLGVGIGDVTTDLSEVIEEIDGPAFHHSSEALYNVKKKRRWIAVGSEEDTDSMECILNLIFDIMWSWTSRRKEIILFYRKNGEDSKAIEKASLNFNTGFRNIYKTLEAGKYPLIKYAENVLKKEFEKCF